MSNTIKTIFLAVLAFGFGVSAMAQVPDQYIYFDLAAGSVNFYPQYGTYSGFVYSNGVAVNVTGPLSPTNKYYIYQSSTEPSSPGYYLNTGYASDADFNAKQNIHIPAYSPITGPGGQDWDTFSTNNTDVVAVHNQWVSSAINDAKRTSCNNVIWFNQASYSSDANKYDIILDNVWSEYYDHENGYTAAISTDCNSRGEFIFKLKNYSKFNHIKFDRLVSMSGGLHFTSIDGDGSTSGSLVVTYTENNGLNPNSYNSCALIGSVYCAPNGGNFTNSPCYNLFFNGGSIYVGLQKYVSNSLHMVPTTIGGGGNAAGDVTITGGKITAVTASSGSAIGGGGGSVGLGADGLVTISGGEIYAYNFGLYNKDQETRGYLPPSMAGTAIGGGSTQGGRENGLGGNATVTISGGYVYAQSVGGIAIGGGNSTCKRGGNGNVNISGGTIVAKSISGQIGLGSNIGDWSASTAIGGGTGGYETDVPGGDAIITISGSPTITTGSIGGGKTNNATGKIGTAQINISGSPVISGQFILAAGAGSAPKFTMTSGTICSSSTFDTEFPKVQANGGAVYIEDGMVTMSGGTISGCTALNGAAYYIKGGTFTTSGNSIISGNIAQKDSDGKGGNGGGLFVEGGTVTFTNGRLTDNIAVNGGGLFLASGANMTFNGGIIKNNHAKASEGYDGPNTAYAGTTGQEGFGGGLYVQSGTSTISTLSIQIAADADFGIYDNDASTGADDILAEGNKTSINIPDVKNMQLAEFTTSAYPNWYEDYHAGDSNYSNGLNLHAGCTTFDRFINMLDNTAHYAEHRYMADGTALSGKYLNLKLGYESLKITISVTGLNEKETAYYQLIYHRPDGDVYYPVLLLGDGSSKISKTLLGMPWGSYSAIQDKNWTWAYNVQTPNPEGKYENVPVVGVDEKEFPFTVQHISGDDNVLHDEEYKVNEMLNNAAIVPDVDVEPFRKSDDVHVRF